ncbi:MAG: transposase [Patescibacteria group bacterium]
MRKIKFIPNSYYHICNKSNDGQSIFFDVRDYARFLFSILFYQASVPFYNLSRQTSYFAKNSEFKVSSEIIQKITNARKVELNIFTIMPNHFHLLLQEKSQKGVSSYLQRIQTGYAKYFNTKYKKQGHLFQGTFHAVPVETDEQLLYLSAYIHRNSRELNNWKNKEIEYPWSSYQDLVENNRWGELLKPGIVLNQFPNANKYYKFVETSTAKREKPPIKDLFLE